MLQGGDLQTSGAGGTGGGRVAGEDRGTVEMQAVTTVTLLWSVMYHMVLSCCPKQFVKLSGLTRIKEIVHTISHWELRILKVTTFK